MSEKGFYAVILWFATAALIYVTARLWESIENFLEKRKKNKG